MDSPLQSKQIVSTLLWQALTNAIFINSSLKIFVIVLKAPVLMYMAQEPEWDTTGVGEVDEG